MQISFVKALRRTLGGLIAIIILAVSLNYVHTFRQRARLVKLTANILSTEMLRSADTIEYSENENGVARFKIRAEKLLETRQGKSLLQGIEAYDFNPDGTVRNQIRSRMAEYDREHKKALFSDNVRIQIGKGAELKTNSLSYDLEANSGFTSDRVQFSLPQGNGTAQGAQYDHVRKLLILQNDISFLFHRTSSGPDGKIRTEDVQAFSRQGSYAEETGIIRFAGDARLVSTGAELSGDEIEAGFSSDRKRIQSLFCRGKAAYKADDGNGIRTLRGDLLRFSLDQTNGALEKIDAIGQADFATQSGTMFQELRGEEIYIGLDPNQGSPRNILGLKGTEFRAKKDIGETVLTGNRLEADFLPKTNLLANLQITERARMLTRGRSETQPEELQAEMIHLRFQDVGGRSAPQELSAKGAVKWDAPPRPKTKAAAGQPARSLSAASLNVLYSSTGENPESGSASGNVLLSGMPSEGAGAGEIRKLRADRVHFRFSPKDGKLRDFDGDGNVRIHFSKAEDAAGKKAADEYQTSSENMHTTFREADGATEAVAQWGAFILQEGARTATSGRGDYDALRELLVLQDSPRISDESGVTTGESMQYDRRQKVLTVSKHVRSVLKPKRFGKEVPSGDSAPSGSASIIIADEMTYWTEAGRAKYSGYVQMLSESGQLQAAILEVFDSGERIEAQGGVKHLILREERPDQGKAAPPKKPSSVKAGKSSASSVPTVINCERLSYSRKENVIHYSGKATLQSDELWLSASNLDALLNAAQNKIEQATAWGNLFMRQEEREVRGERGEYYLSQGKFVVLGNPAEIKDPVRGKSFAQRLTFFTTDDRILFENR